MTLGKQPLSCGAMPRSNRLWSLRVLAAVLLLLGVLGFLAGCGGGSSPKPTPSSSPTPSDGTAATIVGRVVDRYAGNNGVDGLTVTFTSGGTTLTTTTSGGGNFTLNVAKGLSNSVLKVNLTSAYYDSAQIQGGNYNIASSGFTVPSLTEGQVYQTGEIAIASVNAGPPPPPIFP